ncbi:FecR domain-containing protein [Parasphingorhabdus sp.]|uniref:FecR family protein n=2 Tax=Parasphingorhabdus sp. TaxID=2709688 RepID=UPI00326691E6
MTSDSHMNEKPVLTDAISATAIQWVLRQRDGDMQATDWTAFTEWLEADPKHLTAYDRVLEADDDLATVGQKLTPASDGNRDPDESVAANDNGGGLLSRWPAFGALAAVLLAFVVFWPASPSPQFATLQTEVGEIREVAINSSISMVVNGNSKLTLDKESATVRMQHGEATYRVNSPEPGALRVEIDSLVLVDYGTVFNVIRDDDNLRVAVIEGAVMIDPQGSEILVTAGEQIKMQLKDKTLMRSDVELDAVLAWQGRQLLFEDRPVAEVIDDIERNFGTRISVSDNVSDQNVSGVISLENGEATVITDVAAILGSTAQKTEAGWIIGN